MAIVAVEGVKMEINKIHLGDAYELIKKVAIDLFVD